MYAQYVRTYVRTSLKQLTDILVAVTIRFHSSSISSRRHTYIVGSAQKAVQNGFLGGPFKFTGTFLLILQNKNMYIVHRTSYYILLIHLYSSGCCCGGSGSTSAADDLKRQTPSDRRFFRRSPGSPEIVIPWYDIQRINPYTHVSARCRLWMQYQQQQQQYQQSVQSIHSS